MEKIQEAQDQYYLNLTDETIEKLKAEGQDVEILYKNREEARARQQEKLTDITHLERLDPFKQTPRDPKSAFVKKAVKGNKNMIAAAQFNWAAAFLTLTVPCFSVLFSDKVL